MIVRTTKLTEGEDNKLIPVGTEIEHEDAWRLVTLGVAEPVDQEATDKIAVLLAENEARQQRRADHALLRAAAGVSPGASVRKGGH